MDLLEYQAKELFRRVNIPLLPAQRIDRPTDIKALKIPYPVVLKSQVSVANRGKAGGIRFVENTIDAIAAARTIFNLPIGGEYPQVLLAEAKYDTSRELYLAIAIDRIACRPVLLGSDRGLERIERVVVKGEFSPFYARKLAIEMGLSGKLMLEVSQTIERMYTLMKTYDLDSVEIDPLAIDSNGKVMALDGKISANPKAIARHSDLVRWQSGRAKISSPTRPIYLDRERGNIGILCHGTGIALSILDAMQRGGGNVKCCVTIDSMKGRNFNEAFELLKDRQIKVLLIDLVGSDIDFHSIAEIAIKYPAKIIWRVLESELVSLGDITDRSLELVADLDRAIVETIDRAEELATDPNKDLNKDPNNGSSFS
jgi:succinyl-CoA synthetase beta subunit